MFWWVDLDLFSLECNEVSSIEFLRVYGFGMALGSLSFNAQSCALSLLYPRNMWLASGSLLTIW